MKLCDWKWYLNCGAWKLLFRLSIVDYLISNCSDLAYLGYHLKIPRFTAVTALLLELAIITEIAVEKLRSISPNLPLKRSHYRNRRQCKDRCPSVQDRCKIVASRCKIKASVSELKICTGLRYLCTQGGYALRPIQCYSCMSESARKTWGALTALYRRPINFTDHCGQEFTHHSRIGLISCDQPCLTLVENLYFSGKIYDRVYYRGCMSRMFAHGPTNVLVQLMERENQKCAELKQSEIFPTSALDSPTGMMLVCSCYGDRCNSGPSLTNRSSFSGFSLANVGALCALLAVKWHRR